MADDNQQEQQEGQGRGASTAVKAAAAVAATGAAAYGAKKALSHRGGDNGHSSNGSSSSRKGDMGEMLNSVLTGGWEAARDALVPAAEDAAGAAGEYLAKNGPEFVREKVVPRFIESFNEASGGS
ncbi:MAG: hypothetical protein E6G24_00535 [Actinobacteria bacterium]|jgi:hypothetical protein|nr:MAG: hypothetical protein E6G24_00535 [Actinomycetota bacterium]